MSTYKRYKLYLLLYDGTFFNKEFNKKTKDEYINVVSRVSKELFAHQIKYNTQYKKPIINIKNWGWYCVYEIDYTIEENLHLGFVEKPIAKKGTNTQKKQALIPTFVSQNQLILEVFEPSFD